MQKYNPFAGGNILRRTDEQPKRSFFTILFILAFAFVYSYYTDKKKPVDGPDNTKIIEAYKNKKSDVIVTGSGTVIKLLPDDLQGSKHQKFIVKLKEDLTLLISHNIDLAPRINTLKKGDLIQFKGEYEWNEKGGVVHWTHKDPQNKHPHGYILHLNKYYQ